MVTQEHRLIKAIADSCTDDFQFFRTAYLWKFGVINNSQLDVSEYRSKGVIPLYVHEYVRSLYD